MVVESEKFNPSRTLAIDSPGHATLFEHHSEVMRKLVFVLDCRPYVKNEGTYVLELAIQHYGRRATVMREGARHSFCPLLDSSELFVRLPFGKLKIRKYQP